MTEKMLCKPKDDQDEDGDDDQERGQQMQMQQMMHGGSNIENCNNKGKGAKLHLQIYILTINATPESYINMFQQ